MSRRFDYCQAHSELTGADLARRRGPVSGASCVLRMPVGGGSPCASRASSTPRAAPRPLRPTIRMQALCFAAGAARPRSGCGKGWPLDAPGGRRARASAQRLHVARDRARAHRTLRTLRVDRVQAFGFEVAHQASDRVLADATDLPAPEPREQAVVECVPVPAPRPPADAPLLRFQPLLCQLGERDPPGDDDPLPSRLAPVVLGPERERLLLGRPGGQVRGLPVRRDADVVRARAVGTLAVGQASLPGLVPVEALSATSLR
jgi:hypothetical protein